MSHSDESYSTTGSRPPTKKKQNENAVSVSPMCVAIFMAEEGIVVMSHSDES